MGVPSDWRIVGRRSLNADEIGPASRLVDRRNRCEGLELPLDVSPESTAGRDVVGFVLASARDALVGYLQLLRFGEVEVCLAVDPAHRRRGVGRALLNVARDEVARPGRWLSPPRSERGPG